MDKSIDSIMVSVLQEMRDLSVAVGNLNVQLQQLKTQVDRLSEVVITGNGHSLVTRVVLLEDNSAEAHNKLDELVKSMESMDKNKKEDRRAKLNTYGAIVPAILALVASIVALIY